MKSKAFACYNKDINIRRDSSSGGIYYLLAEEVIRCGGVVYGACYEGTEIKHRRITDTEGISASCGSKYVESDLRDSFMSVRRDLAEGRQVLFAGVPCQCAGVLAFVGKQQKDLYCLDLICHGVPGKKAWRSYIAALHAKGFDLKTVNMRDKSKGWKGYGWKLKSVDGKEKLQSHHVNSFMQGFLANIYLRPSCYACRFKGVERDTDITLGDYWGVWRIQPQMYDDMGTSLVLAHSEKGMELLRRISDRIVIAEALLEEAIAANPCMVRSVERPASREKFFRKIEAGEDFITVVESMTRRTLWRRIKSVLDLRDSTQEDRQLKDGSLFYGKKEDCSGCTACYAVCPVHAITISEDEEGSYYPSIERERCVACGKYVQICPNHQQL